MSPSELRSAGMQQVGEPRCAAVPFDGTFVSTTERTRPAVVTAQQNPYAQIAAHFLRVSVTAKRCHRHAAKPRIAHLTT